MDCYSISLPQPPDTASLEPQGPAVPLLACVELLTWTIWEKRLSRSRGGVDSTQMLSIPPSAPQAADATSPLL